MKTLNELKLQENRYKGLKSKKPVLVEQTYNPRTESNKPVKYLSKRDGERLKIDEFPNFSSTGSISGMKKQYYGKGALLVKCGNYIYHVSSDPDIYFNKANDRPY